MSKPARNSVSHRGDSVKDDWRAQLPEEKSRVFGTYVHHLEATYGMLSVTLNEALELQRQGQLGKSCQAIHVTPDLCARLCGALASLIRVLGQHAKHYGTLPRVASLNPENFQSAKGQRDAGYLAECCFPSACSFHTNWRHCRKWWRT